MRGRVGIAGQLRRESDEGLGQMLPILLATVTYYIT